MFLAFWESFMKFILNPWSPGHALSAGLDPVGLELAPEAMAMASSADSCCHWAMSVCWTTVTVLSSLVMMYCWLTAPAAPSTLTSVIFCCSGSGCWPSSTGRSVISMGLMNPGFLSRVSPRTIMAPDAEVASPSPSTVPFVFAAEVEGKLLDWSNQETPIWLAFWFIKRVNVLWRKWSKKKYEELLD